MREATLKVLRNRPGQRLTVAQIRTLIRKDTNRRASRQSVNVNLDILEQAGFRYDSSLFPVLHDRYGVPGAPRGPYRQRNPDGP